MTRCLLALLFCVPYTGFNAHAAADEVRPNVVLIITDDQGYGDIGAHGNSMLRTPHLDALHVQSVRLTDFHVDPTCSPTRSALMTGRYSTRTGVWHTIAGRSLMRTSELTMAEVFAANGYRTGQFGKWHLGDNYPMRPHDQGFEECLHHGGGGVTQTPDFWGNDYFDDTYLRNGVPEACEGYCTDVWFREAAQFIESHRNESFFCYIATNAPHSPYFVASEWKQLYLDAGVAEPMASFYGMIANIDHNIGLLRSRLDELGLSENTIVIFMTDNGTAEGAGGDSAASNGWSGFNAGMRGQKGSAYDGGHRVPCFIHWPAGGLDAGRDVSLLSAHIDLLPTLCDLCSLDKPEGPPLDGQSLAIPVLGWDAPLSEALTHRTLFVHSQRVETPEKWRTSAVMTSRFRLVNGRELYDITRDPGQLEDVAARYPDVVQRMRTAYEVWWEDLSPSFDQDVRIVIGSDEANLTTLTCHDWHSEDVPWNQQSVERDPEANGYWLIEVAQAGRYEFELRLRPPGVSRPLSAGRAIVAVDEARSEVAVSAGDEWVRLTMDLKAGSARLQTWVEESAGPTRGAYFVIVRRLSVE
jgi:arylsulfatase A-like enzyme